MERLTERGEDGKYFVRISRDSDLILGAEERLLPGLEKWTGWWEHTVLGNIVDRLAAYEDTGLIPEEAQQMRWIPVEERLPEENVTVLAFNADPHAEKYVLARYRVVVHFGYCWCQFDQEYDSWCASCWKVTHWMPLPSPPKEEAYEK